MVDEYGLVSRCLIPLSRQIRSNRAGRAPAEPGREHLAVAGEDLGGDPVPGQRLFERLADRPGGGPHDRLGADHEPGMVIDPGHDLHFGAVREEHPAHHVHLPQVHRPRPLPPPVILPRRRLLVPKISSAQVEVATGFSGSRASWLLCDGLFAAA
ncbi:MAG TPA: hypothetical protein VFW50_45315 [Streptosporangiaceae bacterium]|nr:hypothetical protein [Streptosporangiaceae bacterium]